MGDRAIVIFHNKEKTQLSPAIYSHWGGDNIRDYIPRIKEFMVGRKDDVQYASARLCGLLHNDTPGNMSLGLWNTSDEMLEWSTEDWLEYSHGDAGVLFVNADDFSFVQYGGGGHDKAQKVDRVTITHELSYRNMDIEYEVAQYA